jgi:hypothetical protein
LLQIQLTQIVYSIGFKVSRSLLTLTKVATQLWGLLFPLPVPESKFDMTMTRAMQKKKKSWSQSYDFRIYNYNASVEVG